MERFVALVNWGEKPLVLRKLASSLVAVFLRPNTSWNRAICDLAESLSNRNQVPKEQYLPSDFEGAALPALNELQIAALLLFSTTMAEEAVKRSAQVRKRSVINGSQFLASFQTDWQQWRPPGCGQHQRRILFVRFRPETLPPAICFGKSG